MEHNSPKGSQFNIRQPQYLESYGNFKDPDSFKPIANVVERYLKHKNPTSVRCLDSMAGTGLVGRKMQELFPGIKVVYQDGSIKMLSFGAYQNSDERILLDATTLDVAIADKSFDIVFCRAGLNNVKKEDYPKILAGQLRVLNNNGILILMDHFAQTEEEKKVINQIETEVKRIEGISDEVYVPTMEDLRGLIKNAGGKITDEQLSRVRFSMKERFISKGIKWLDFFIFRKILKAQNVLKYKETGDDIILIYPITTIAIQKIIIEQGESLLKSI